MNATEIGFQMEPPARVPESLEELEQLLQENPTTTPAPWPDPENLGDELPPVPAFDPELLPSTLRAMVEDIADRMQVPIDLPAVSAITTLSGVCGRRALVQPKEFDPWKVVPNLWGAIVAGPGMMKSPLIHDTTASA